MAKHGDFQKLVMVVVGVAFEVPVIRGALTQNEGKGKLQGGGDDAKIYGLTFGDGW